MQNKVEEKQMDWQQSKSKDHEEIKNQRITRRMKKIIQKNQITFFNNDQDKCAICLHQCQKSSTTLPCSHAFCMGCIANWWITHQTCPYCRQSFNFIYDYRGRRLTKDQLPKNLIFQREDSLKCQTCWADIGDQPLKICCQCRSIYNHKRCLTKEEVKMKTWKCQQCFDNEQLQIKKKIQKQEKRNGFSCYLKMEQSLTHRQSQRIISQHGRQKLKNVQ